MPSSGTVPPGGTLFSVAASAAPFLRSETAAAAAAAQAVGLADPAACHMPRAAGQPSHTVAMGRMCGGNAAVAGDGGCSDAEDEDDSDDEAAAGQDSDDEDEKDAPMEV